MIIDVLNEIHTFNLYIKLCEVCLSRGTQYPLLVWWRGVYPNTMPTFLGKFTKPTAFSRRPLSLCPMILHVLSFTSWDRIKVNPLSFVIVNGALKRSWTTFMNKPSSLGLYGSKNWVHISIIPHIIVIWEFMLIPWLCMHNKVGSWDNMSCDKK